MSARINTKFALTLFLAAAILGGGGYGLYWRSTHRDPDVLDAKGDRAAARAQALAAAGDGVGANHAYVEACNRYGEVLQQNASYEPTLTKFRTLTITLGCSSAEDATKWAIQHMIACRHAAQISADPAARGNFYRYALRLTTESQSLDLAQALWMAAGDDLGANPDRTLSRIYRGAAAYHMAVMKAPDGAQPPADQRAKLLEEAAKDLEEARKADPADPAACAHLALVRMAQIKNMPPKDLWGEPGKTAAADAMTILATAQAAHPADLALAVQAARAACTAAPLTGISGEKAVRTAVRLALANEAALSPVDRAYLCELACATLTAPQADDPAGRSQGLHAAMELAKRGADRHPGTPELAALASAQAFAGAHGDAVATLQKALAQPDLLPVADRLAIEARRHLLLFQLAGAQLNQAIATSGADRERLTRDARETTDRLRRLKRPDMAGPVLQLEAQELFLGRRYEEAASRFTLALRTNPELATPSFLRTAGICHLRCGNLGAAAKLLEDALSLDPGGAKNHLLLARIMLQMGYPEEAIDAHLKSGRADAATQQLSGDLAMRAGRFWDAAESYGGADALSALPKRAAALRALGRGEQAREEAMGFLRAGAPSANRTFLTCLALEPGDRPFVLAEMEKAGLSKEDAASVRAALDKPPAPVSDEDQAANPFGLPMPSGVTQALELWKKADFAAFGAAMDKAPQEVALQPDILSHRIELAILRRDWENARTLAARAQELRLDLPLGSAPAVLASITAMQSLETGSPAPADAAGMLREAAKQSPASAGIWALLANVLLADDKPVEAAGAAEMACRLQPHRADRLQLLFQCQLRTGHAADCLKFLRRMSDSLPFNDDLRELWLTSEEAVGNPDTVEKVRAARAQSTPEDLFNALRLAGIRTRAGRTDEARQILLKAAPRTAEHPQAALPLAAALCRAGFPDEARASLGRLLTRFPPAQVALWTAQLGENAGDAAAETAAWQAALNLEPTDTRPTSQAYAARLASSGRPADAAAFLRALLGQTPDASPLKDGIRMSLGQALCSLEKFDEAMALADGMSALRGALFRSSVSMARERDDDAVRFARQATELAPDNPETWVNLGQVLSADPLREAQAQEAVRRALGLSPTHAGARHLEAMLDAQAGRYRLAINRLWRNLALNPGHSPSFTLLTELSFQEQDSRAAQGLAVAGLQAKPEDLAYLRSAARAALARFRSAKILGYRTEGQASIDWATAFQTQAMRRSDNPLDAAKLLSILVETGRTEEALDMLSRLTPQARQLPPLLALRAAAMAKAGRADADAAFADALRACTDDEEVGECLRLAGLALPEKTSLLLARRALGESRAPFARLGLGRAALLFRLPEEAYAELAPLAAPGAAENLGNAGRARMLGALGTAEDQLGREDAAAAHYRQAVRLDTHDVVSLNNLSDILLRRPDLAQNPDEAMDAARRTNFIAARAAASGLVPRRELASIRDTLGQALAQAGRTKEASAVFDAALLIFPIPESHLHLGGLLEADHLDEKARAHYLEAVRLADAGGQKQLAAEGRWRLDPRDFKANADYARALADTNPKRARTLAETCIGMARTAPPPPEQLAALMRVCEQLWKDPKPGATVAQGMQTARELADLAATRHPDSAPYLLLQALGQAQMGDGTWEGGLDRALSLQAAGSSTAPRMPRGLPLPPISAHAATQSLPDSPWDLTHESMLALSDLLAAGPPCPPLARIFPVLDLQSLGRHRDALDALSATDDKSPATDRRLAAASLAALGQTQKAADMLAAVVANGGSLPDRVRLLGLLQRLERPEAELSSMAQAALKLDPDCAAAREALGDLALARRDFAAATAIYEKIDVASAPAVCVKRARALRELGRGEGNANLLRDGLAKCPFDPWILEEYFKSEPDPERRQKAFIGACETGLDPDLAIAFAKAWDLTLHPGTAGDKFLGGRKRPSGAAAIPGAAAQPTK